MPSFARLGGVRSSVSCSTSRRLLLPAAIPSSALASNLPSSLAGVADLFEARVAEAFDEHADDSALSAKHRLE